MSAHHLTIASALLLIGSAACDGVGRPLVDWQPAGGAIPYEVCGSESMCDLPSLPPGEWATLNTAPVTVPGCAPPGATASPESAMSGCEPLRWPVTALVSEVSETGFKLNRRNWIIASETPLLVTLVRTELEDVWIALRGLVTLRFVDHSRLKDVRINMTYEQGEPAVALDDSEASNLVVTSTEAMPLGNLSVARSQVQTATNPSGVWCASAWLPTPTSWPGLARSRRCTSADVPGTFALARSVWSDARAAIHAREAR